MMEVQPAVLLYNLQEGERAQTINWTSKQLYEAISEEHARMNNPQGR